MTVNGRPVVAFSEVGLAAAVGGLGLISMTVGADARKGISEGLLVRVLADWDMGEVELLAVFPARKAAKPSARAFVDLLASSTVMIFPSAPSSPRDQRAWRLLTRVCRRSEKSRANRSKIAAQQKKFRVRRIRHGWHFSGHEIQLLFRLDRDRASGARSA